MKLSYLWRGLPGHPIHPPLTDITIGTYTFATVAGLAEVTGITTDSGAYGWWIALVFGLIATVPTALTGLAEWLSISRGTELWRTATAHLIAMVSATVFFLLAARATDLKTPVMIIAGGAYPLPDMGSHLHPLGGWGGGAIVFVHGMRVLNLLHEPARRALAPVPHREKEEAEN